MRNEHDLLLIPIADKPPELRSAGIESLWINSVLAFVEVPAMLYVVKEDYIREFLLEDFDRTARVARVVGGFLGHGQGEDLLAAGDAWCEGEDAGLESSS